MVPIFPVDVLPLPSEDLVGRDGILSDLERRVLQGQSVLIPGPRRVGKSAVAFELLRRVADSANALTASVDLFECGDVRELARKMAAAILAGVDPRWRRLQLKTDRAMAEGLRNSEVAVSVLGLDVLRWIYRVERLDTGELLDRALDLPAAVSDRLRRPTVMVFDEFQELAALDPSLGVFKRMRAHWQRTRGAYLFLGSQGSLVRSLFAQSRMPLYRFADLVPLPRIPADDWVRYITHKFEGAGCPVSPGVPEELVQRTGGHAFDTMKVLQAVSRRLPREGGAVTRDVAWLGYVDAARDLGRYFETEIQALGLKLSRALLVRLANNQPLYVSDASSSQIHQTTQGLVTQGILERPRPRRYEFVEPMLAEYLRGRIGS
ncbi:MAG: ATP-binding protein [Thermaerobacter sp.]|nr:ATP-binding protein [Thermaerobacter sp.]